LVILAVRRSPSRDVLAVSGDSNDWIVKGRPDLIATDTPTATASKTLLPMIRARLRCCDIALWFPAVPGLGVFVCR
jgi:hypothetical protein